jgi:hypothetical protein
MVETIHLGDIAITVTRKNVKHAYLSVHPPSGRVTLVAPKNTRPEVARAYAVSRLGWIRNHRAGFRAQARQAPRKYIERESHFLWGRRYLLSVREADARPSVKLDHRKLTLTIRPSTNMTKREEVMHAWHLSLLHEVVPGLIRKWEPTLGVKVARYYLQRMKTRWGGCNHRARTIRLNTELVKKPRDLLEYVVVHEMLHLITPIHSDQFLTLLNKHYPSWREARAELNELPLAAEVWNE